MLIEEFKFDGRIPNSKYNQYQKTIQNNSFYSNPLSRSYNNISYKKKISTNITDNSIINPVYFGKSSFEYNLPIDNDPILDLRKKYAKRYDANMKKQINFLSNFIGNYSNNNRFNRPINNNLTTRKDNFSINYTTLISDLRDNKNDLKNNKYRRNYEFNNNYNTLFNDNIKKERKFFGDDEEIKQFRESFKRKK